METTKKPKKPKKPKKVKPNLSQKQKQKQSVVVNINQTTKRSAARRSGPTSTAPAPHNLVPNIIQQATPQIDYTPLFAAMQNNIKVAESVPIVNPVTPLSQAVQNSVPSAMPGIAAEERRAGRTAALLVHPPSLTRTLSEPIPISTEQVRAPDAYVTEQLQKSGGGGGGIPMAQSSGIPMAQSSGIPMAQAQFVPPRTIGSRAAAGITNMFAPRQAQQSTEKSNLLSVIDAKLISGEKLSQPEMSKARLLAGQKTNKLGAKRTKEMIAAGYTQFTPFLK
jgi:hypothetical protein